MEKLGNLVSMERVAHKARGFKEADEWEIRQHLAMTPRERMRAARVLKERMFPGKNPDVREWHRATSGRSVRRGASAGDQEFGSGKLEKRAEPRL